MRWRMLEYYCAIQRRCVLDASNNVPKVRQIVALVGSPTSVSSELRRDRVNFDFEVIRLASLDRDRRLFASTDPYEWVLGLLCVKPVYPSDWEQVIERLWGAGQAMPERARDAVALLSAIAGNLLPAPDQIIRHTKELAMRLRVAESSVLGEIICEQRLTQGRALLWTYLSGTSTELSQNDRDFIDSLDHETLELIFQRLGSGESWPMIRDEAVGPGLGD